MIVRNTAHGCGKGTPRPRKRLGMSLEEFCRTDAQLREEMGEKAFQDYMASVAKAAQKLADQIDKDVLEMWVRG